MIYFNFHHHDFGVKHGIYNLASAGQFFEGEFSCGIHPKDIFENWKSDFEAVKKRVLDDNCIAIGECGLDGMIAAPEELQEQVFEAHISLAEQTGKPLIIHCVRRFQEVQRLCKDRKIHKIIHGFNKNEILAEEILRHGFYLSFGFAALHSLSLQKIISEMPIDRIFLETDSRDFQISELYEKVAALKNISPENLEKQISENLKNIQHGR